MQWSSHVEGNSASSILALALLLLWRLDFHGTLVHSMRSAEAAATDTNVPLVSWLLHADVANRNEFHLTAYART
ncbi:hypothetical protein SUGI_0304820 [Cryptomeria japonica]|nr:hypothetical protein SUGI_0304820 [Cryptomeria japonica]